MIDEALDQRDRTAHARPVIVPQRRDEPGAVRREHEVRQRPEPERSETIPAPPGRRRRSVGAQRGLGRSPRSADAIDAALVALVDRVTRRLRFAGRAGRTVILRLRFGDFTRATRSHTLARSTAQTEPILTAARDLLASARPLIERQGITLIGVSVGNLDLERAGQLELPFEADDGRALDSALDAVRERFGAGAITRAVLLGTRQGHAMPLLPD